MQKRFNSYYLTEQVGSKPLRSAYLAHPINDVSQKVILKIFDATCLACVQESDRLFHQMEWIKQLRHAHIVPILDLGIEQGQPYVVSEYLSGGSLRHRLDSLSPGRLSFEEALKIILQVGQALSYCHGIAHLHQNIKPENIFFNERDEVLLADFCLSGFIDVATLNYQSDPRNMCYMAPEQFIGSASEKSDQYALACLAYELIAGQVPFSAQSFAMMWASHYAQFPAPLSDLVPDLPKRIEKVVFKAMVKDPSERYADIAAFLLAFEGTVLSPVPPIIRPLALSTFDPFSLGAAESLENRKSGIPSEESLASAPFGTSLAGAPFGMSLSGAVFGASLPGAVFGASLPGIPGTPFGMSLPGSPFAASLAGMALATSQEGENLEEEKEENPSEMSLPGTPFGMSLAGSPFAVSLAGMALAMSQEGEILEKEKEENPSEMNVAGNVFETSQKEDFLEEVLGKNPFETGLMDTPPTTHLLERWEHASNEPYSNINPNTLTGRNRSDSFSRGHLWRNTKYSIPAFLSRRPRKPSAVIGWLIQLRGYLENFLGAVSTSFRRGHALFSRQLAHLFERGAIISSGNSAKKSTVAGELAGNALIKSFSVGRIFQRREDSIPVVLFGQCRELPTPALWFVLVASIITLIGGIASYSFSTFQISEQLKSVNMENKQQDIIDVKNAQIDNQLIAQPVAHATGMLTPQQNSPSSLSESLSQTSLIGTYAEQSQTYNLSSEGRLDWINWGLHMPRDVNRKSGVQQQISTFAVIGNRFNTSSVQHASYNANARLWWSDGTPVMMAQPQQATGVYVRGVDEGFSFSVLASTIPRRLRVYVAVNGAQGKFTASLNGRIYVDESLSTAYDANGPQVNGIYTLVFNSSMSNQVLTVTYTAMKTDGINGYVLLRSASLR